jgi:hypothetical protein
LATERRLPATRDRAWAALAASPLTVATVLLAAVTIHTLLADRVASPWIMVDELVYSDLARSFAGGHGLAIRGDQTWVYGLLYPILVAPAWLAHSIARSYELAKAINVLLMSAAGVPLYIWARRLVPPAWALLALGLVLLLPAQLYAGTVMTENAFLPAFMLAGLAFGLALYAVNAVMFLRSPAFTHVHPDLSEALVAVVVTALAASIATALATAFETRVMEAEIEPRVTPSPVALTPRA